MINTLLTSTLLLIVSLETLQAQPNKALTTGLDNKTIPLSKADLGTFPYVKTLPNFKPSDSVTIEQNRTYFFDGKTYFTVDGQVSAQQLRVTDRAKKIPSEFQLIQTFDQLVATLGVEKFMRVNCPMS